MPEVYRTFLLRMGRKSGELFRGSDLLDLDRPEETDEVVREILNESPGFVLPPRAHVLLTHQGYSLQYTVAEGGFDTPAWWLSEGETEPGGHAQSFAELLDQELQLMEKLHHDQHGTGGHFLEVGEGYLRETHPARVSEERPLDQPERFVEAGESLSSSGELFRKSLGKLNSEEK
ncbi:hypothetical protein V3W47_10915 [Deinococcus sp. YIM 134068]